MPLRIALIQGHPDPAGNHFGHALLQAYADGANSGNHEAKTITVARLEFPILQTEDDWEHSAPVASIRQAQEIITWADHVVIFYPLWLGTMPAVLKAFLEQTLRPGFAISMQDNHAGWKRLLKGKSCRVVVTMGMPAVVYRWFFRAHSLKSLERNVLKFCGFSPIRESLIGLVAADSGTGREKWLKKLQQLGAKAR